MGELQDPAEKQNRPASESQPPPVSEQPDAARPLDNLQQPTEVCRASFTHQGISILGPEVPFAVQISSYEVRPGTPVRAGTISDALVIGNPAGEFLPLVALEHQDSLLFIRESTIYPDDFDAHIERLLKSGAAGNLKDVPIIPGKTLFLAGPGAENPYHWTHDCLPRLLAAQAQLADFSVLVPKIGDSNKSVLEPEIRSLNKYVAESLALLGIGPDRIISCDNKPLRFEELVLVEDLCGENNPGTHAHTPLLLDLRASLLELSSHSATAQATQKSSRLYIPREAPGVNRSLTNGPAVEDCLRPYGFDKCPLENMPYADQVQILAQASLVVAPHGAGLVNTLFMSGGSVIELFAKEGAADCWFFIRDCQQQLKHPINWRAIECDIVPEENSSDRRRFKVIAELNSLRAALAEICGRPISEG